MLRWWKTIRYLTLASLKGEGIATIEEMDAAIKEQRERVETVEEEGVARIAHWPVRAGQGFGDKPPLQDWRQSGSRMVGRR